MDYKRILRYLIVGILTTLVNVVFFYIFIKLRINYIVATGISNIVAIIFAYYTNKNYVFKVAKKTDILKEFGYFFLGRIFCLLIDVLFIVILVDIFKMDKLKSKIVITFFIIILNYIFSKKILLK